MKKPEPKKPETDELKGIRRKDEDPISPSSLRRRDPLQRRGHLQQPQTTSTIGEGFNDIYERSNLTKNQLLIWVGQKLHRDAPLYNVILTFTIKGLIDPAHFGKAFQTLINKSDALRRVIEEVDGVPQQRVIREFAYEMEYIDLSQDSEPDAALRSWVGRRSGGRLDLEKRLFDSAMLKVSEDRFAWYLNLHHIIADAWSRSLIFRYMSEFYGLALKDQLEGVSELPSFQDYIDYERSYRGSEKYLKSREYWQGKYAKSIEPIRFNEVVPIKRSTRVRRISYDLGREQTAKLKTIAMGKGIFAISPDLAIFNLLATLLFAYLYRISGNRQLAIGAPFHNRPRKTFKETIGLFTEVCPLRIETSEEETFLSLFDKVISETSESLRHYQHGGEIPLRNKAYDVVLNYNNITFSSFQGLALQTESISTGHGSDSLALGVRQFGSSDSLILDFDFHCDVFNEDQGDRALKDFIQLMDAFLEKGDQPINLIPLSWAAIGRSDNSSLNMPPPPQHQIRKELHRTTR